jgi:Dolichyl-phosphate-mannose-protein mannosyltransferase
MQQNPSLIDWLKLQLSQPRNQRVLRFGFAGLAAAWGGYVLLSQGKQAVAGYFLLALALGFLFWGLWVRGEEVVAPQPGMPAGVSLGTRPGQDIPGGEAPAEEIAASRESFKRLVAALRLPSALALAAAGQAVLIYNANSYLLGLVLMALGVTAFVANLWYDRLLGSQRTLIVPAESRLNFRWWLLAVSLAAGAFAFWDARGNTFRLAGVAAWIVSVAAWLVSVWEWRTPPAVWLDRVRARLSGLAHTEHLTVRVTRLTAMFGLALLVGGYFRFAQLNTIPPEMTPDHVEKLFDVNDVVSGKRPIFFERNTGREPIQFYFAAILVEVFNTGFTHLTLKITSAVAGFLMLPFMFLLGRELEDTVFGLLAMLMAGISFWATAISRVGLRFPLNPLFVAPVLFFLLRGVRRSSRNDFLLAGLFLGIGLYGYSPIRVLPIAVAAAIVWFWLWPQTSRARRQMVTSGILLFTTTFIVFLPLFRYATEPANIFWWRSLTRMGTAEKPIDGSPLIIFLQNNVNALAMFNWRGDLVWVNTIPTRPVLDFITGALFIFGVVYLLARLVLRRDRVAGVLLLLIPILLLPSTLSLAFPIENPSVVRTGGAIPVVFLIAAYPLWILWKRLRQIWPKAKGRWVGALTLGVIVGGAGLVNRNMYFVEYPAQYIGPAQNASEMGAVVQGFAQSIGSYERAWFCDPAFWFDPRAIGIYAGKLGWDQVMKPEQFATLVGDTRPLLVILNLSNKGCIASMRANFPTGKLSVVHSARGPGKDFLVYFVPGTVDVNEKTLPAQ